ncbi:MAG: restriction endonuclease subunit S [Chitinophagaceae bacterium]|nr:restriction endonuclease subunit S [Chitinophagaceae bacterium]
MDDACFINFGTRVVNKKDGGSIYPVYGGGGATFKMDSYNRENCLVVSRFAMSKQCTRFVDGKFYLNDSGLTVRPKNEKELAQEYLDYLLLTLNETIYSFSRGTAQRNMNVPTFRKLEIKYPDSTDLQLHIANLLSKAENLIAQRKESIRLLDEFLKSSFLEMFGDPVRNEKGWEINSLSRFGSLKNGLNYTRSESGVHVRCLGVGDFKDYSKLTDIESLQILNLTSEPNIEYYLNDGDLVFVRSNGNRELVGRCLLVYPKNEKVTFSGFCIRYRIESKGLNPIFVSHLFRVPIFRTAMLQGGKGANIQNISQQTLEKLKIPTPPIELQTQFAQIVEKTEVLKNQYQQSLQELQNLYGSLSQRAFKGDLEFSKEVARAE